MAGRRPNQGRAPRGVPRGEAPPLAPGVLRGHEALARADWARARACFEGALGREETAEALEGLGMAAFWLDDAPCVFDARERAYRLYQRGGDRRGAGRVAMTLADDYLTFRGEAAVARGWLQRARRLLGGLPPIPEQGWLELWEGHLGLTFGEDPSRVRASALAGAAVGRRLGDIDLEMTALALEGVALIIQGELSEGMPRLDEATTAVVSGEMTDPVAIGRSCCLLVLACEHIRDFERAAQWCHRIKEFCEGKRFNFPLAVCRAHYAGVLRWNGSWVEAEQELQAALRPAALWPLLQQEATYGLAELRRLQGRFDEAAALLQDIDGHPLAMLGRAALALDRSDPRAASQWAERFLRQLPARNRTDRVAALEVLVRARIALGRRTEARASLEELEAIAARVGTEPMKASALLAAGLLAAAEGDPTRGRRALEDAALLFMRSGASSELGRCRLELGRALSDLGERDAAEAELREALLTFERLGAGHHVDRVNALRRRRGAPSAAAAPRDAAAPRHHLTPREVEVLRLVACGMSNQKIAERLVVSEFTVKRHVANLLAKLSLPSRAAAAAHAAREGLA
jgi:LuxR family transcriptional regulator, maltose regulon positive regulatory protein